ncbi:MAG: AGE family epimerase/isomerase [Blastomonas sp.]
MSAAGETLPDLGDLAGWARLYTGWAAEACLPFFAAHGVDRDHGGFYQILDAAGAPDRQGPRHCYAQARQVYSFALGALRGWYPEGRGLALDGLDHLLTRWRARDGRPGFIHSMAPDGTVIDDRRDAYDHAFVLLALAWAWRLQPDPAIRTAIDETLDFADAVLADGAHGGWQEDDRRSQPRRQNPQMHAMEAMLALYEATGDPAMLRRAEGFARLAVERLLPVGNGRMLEFFAADFGPLDDAARDCIEPGHHFEWTWLLGTLGRLGGSVPAGADLMPWALAHGISNAGPAIDRLNPDGSIAIPGCRHWPQSERVKAHLAEAEQGKAGAVEAACHAARMVWQHYVLPAPRGGYIDALNMDGRPTDRRIIPRTLYHVLCMVDELDRVAGRPGKASGY